MNRASLALGAFAIFSLALASMFYPGLASLGLLNSSRLADAETGSDGSSLEQDLRDVLDIMPMAKIRALVTRYALHDRQVAESLAFINEQGRFIWLSVGRMAHVRLLLFYLREFGLEVDRRAEEFRRFWDGLGKLEAGGDKLATGGLTGVIGDILRLVPLDQLHALLRRKRRESRCFGAMLRALRSKQFHELCEAVDGNVVLQRHLHWANDCGIEVVFARELLGCLYVYLTEI